MKLRNLLQRKDMLIIMASFILGLIGILGILVELHDFFILFIIIIMILQISLLLKTSKKADHAKRNQDLSIEEIPLPVIITDKERIRELNMAAVQLVGAANKHELIGKSVFEFIISHGKSSNEQQVPFNLKGKLTRKNGHKLDVELLCSSISSIRKDHKKCYVIKDISALIENEKKLQHSEQLSVIGELAAGIAHEIRNPLTSLKGFLQLSSNSEQNREVYNSIMLSEINRINLIVGELLLLSKPKEMVFRPIHVLSLIKTVVTIVNTQAILYNIEIMIEADHEVNELTVNCEENKLKQVFINILKNGIEAMEKEGKLVIRIKKVNEHVQLIFIDEGKGILKRSLNN
ncbi:histidine kinase dimerization/phospho-acceptor domain-containing protein [Metabacillus sp. Hm71]|uniref:histidine kinase dimerization/phospho-acceptor domain-containing protein n=1 Tax=Metabacillus sp. Hm71 TaxID=3450743 RepID=UPI003F4314AC